MTITVRLEIGPEPELFQLLKAATRLRLDGDTSAAIDLLFRAKEILIADRDGWPEIGQFIKLPVYLRLAGRFDEALRELDWLSKNWPAIVSFAGQNQRSLFPANLQSNMIRHGLRYIRKEERQLRRAIDKQRKG